jgi:antitoxin component of MazEF toxin-antitoxin module
MKNSTWLITLQPDPDGSSDAVMIIPDEVLAEYSWKEGDKLSLEKNEDGSLLLFKPAAR